MTRFFQLLIRNPILCFTLITIANLENGQIWSTANKANTVCNNAECQKLDDMYKKNLNSFGRPCTDFYDYVCHGWGQQFPKPKTAETWGTSQMIQQSVLLELKKMLEEKTEHSQTDLETTKALYRACMAAPYLEKSEPGLLRNITLRTAVWPIIYPKNSTPPLNSHGWAIDHLYIKVAGESALFDFNFLVDERDNDTITLELKHLESPYGMLKPRADWKEAQLSKYKQFLKTIISRVAPLGQKLSDEIVDNDLHATIQFREELAKLIENVKRQSVREEVRNLQHWYDKEVKPGVDAEMNWLLVLRAIYKTPKDPDGLKITQNTVVYVQKQYFIVLAKLLERTPRRIIVNHIHLYFLERHIKIDSSLRILLKDSVTVGIHPSGVIRYEKERFKTCIANNNKKSPLSALYLQTSLTDAKKADVTAIIDVAKEVLKNQIRESNWPDAGARKHVNDKINKLGKTIGYTARVDVPGLDSIMTYACFFAKKNHIYVTAAFLKSPMYTPNVPYEIQYGSTMSILAHELYHAFDYNGMMHDGNGEFAPLTVKMNKEYSDRIECFTDFYQEFKDKAFRKYDFCVYRIFAQDTLDEDFADAMGLKLAYKAYREKLKQNNGTCSVLPSFKGFSCDQMFFVAYANTMCAASSINVQENDLLCDVHSTPQVRINAAVANMKEFTDAFGCKAGDTLNVGKRCDLWK